MICCVLLSHFKGVTFECYYRQATLNLKFKNSVRLPYQSNGTAGEDMRNIMVNIKTLMKDCLDSYQVQQHKS
jgi:hypothetical protein